MKQQALRAPAYPLINIDPYTSIWSFADNLYDDTPRLWPGKATLMLGLAEIDGQTYRFMGKDGGEDIPTMEQTSVSFDTFSTTYTFTMNGVELTACFLSPLIPSDLMLASRPVTYMKVTVSSLDCKAHAVRVTVKVADPVCSEQTRDWLWPCRWYEEKTDDALKTMRLGTLEQAILGKSGDNNGIDWGWFYLSVDGDAEVGPCRIDTYPSIYAQTALHTETAPDALFLFAYDDVHSLIYFRQPIDAYWKKDGQTIEEAIAAAYREYTEVAEKCCAFDRDMVARAEAVGGREYAEMLQLATRQVMAAHKLTIDPNGNLLYVSKECSSNGCAATLDVTYPSIPLYLLYNVELVKGMVRPIFDYAATDDWQFDFAPHDAGRYPILNGQAYGEGILLEYQMPVEECGNMLITLAAIADVEGNADFAAQYREVLDTWVNYLHKYGADPEYQRCTDDFAGNMAHNCNLSIKAIMGLVGYAKLCNMWGEKALAESTLTAAREMANGWVERAANGDGSYRLAFDRPGTYSMKYNVIWDKVWNSGLFPDEVLRSEFESYKQHLNPYGLPLDNRADYTKSDWYLWVASLADTKEEFEEFIHPLWLSYHLTPDRVPMTDWYCTLTAHHSIFCHRTVLGGLWMRLLADNR
ncbi:MAG: DUF4965 domain-containing protein [Clostridia bacterium]|nr:DUF4965 domain-containing protein [Clostridia bacterium]